MHQKAGSTRPKMVVNMLSEEISKPANAEPVQPDAEAQRAHALTVLLGAWDTALSQGCDPEAVANSAIYVALADLVDVYGEAVVARMTEQLPARIIRGEFSMREGPVH